MPCSGFEGLERDSFKLRQAASCMLGEVVLTALLTMQSCTKPWCAPCKNNHFVIHFHLGHLAKRVDILYSAGFPPSVSSRVANIIKQCLLRRWGSRFVVVDTFKPTAYRRCSCKMAETQYNPMLTSPRTPATPWPTTVTKPFVWP